MEYFVSYNTRVDMLAEFRNALLEPLEDLKQELLPAIEDKLLGNFKQLPEVIMAGGDVIDKIPEPAFMQGQI